MTNSNQILVQNVETFETITRLTVATDEGETVTQRVDQYFSKNSNWGIVSLDDDADGEYMSVLLVAPAEGSDWVFDETTQELEPVDIVDPAAELEAKMDIMLELDNDDEELFAAVTVQDTVAAEEATITAATPAKPRKSRNKSTPSKGAKMRNFEILSAFISARPGVARTDVFQDPGLLTSLRTMPQMQAIANGDKLETKRWNRRLNFLIREMRRQGVDIQIERKGRVAHYTIGKPDGQLELPFDDAAEARNATIIGDDVTNEVSEASVPPKQDAMRLVEDANQMVDFESLLATLDDEAVAPVK